MTLLFFARLFAGALIIFAMMLAAGEPFLHKLIVGLGAVSLMVLMAFED